MHTMSLIRHVMCLAASLPVAFLSESYLKVIALHCAMIAYSSPIMTPKTAVVITTLSLVISMMLYCINGGIPQTQEANEILAPLFILSFFSIETSMQTQRPKGFFLRCVEKSLISLINYFYATIVTGNSLPLGLKPEACLYVLLWPWVVTPPMALYESWWKQRHDASM